jgi:multidrug resistance efflux pump
MARLALIVAILALILAWAAYRRTGGELKDLTGSLAGDATAALDRQTDLAQARARLLGRRAEVAGHRNLDQVRQDVAEIRAKLEGAYDDAGAGAKARWRALDAELERLQAQLKEGGSKAVGTLDSALEKIRVEEKKDE